MEENKIWRPVVGFEKKFIANTLGQIYSVKRMGAKGGLIGSYDEINGYVMVSNLNNSTIGLHILIAKTFPDICGEWFDGAVVHHKNFNKLDNRAENLQVMTREEHIKIHHTGTKRSKETCENIRQSLLGKGIGHKNPNTKAILQLSPTGETIKEWPCMKECCEELGLSPQAMRTKFHREHSDVIHWNGYTFKRINH